MYVSMLLGAQKMCTKISNSWSPDLIPEILLGGFFLPGGGNLRWSDLGNSNHFQSLKQLSVNNEHQFKWKLTRPKSIQRVWN